MIRFDKRIVLPLMALLAGASVMLPAILLGMPNNNDLAIHYHYAVPFYDALTHGHWYPGWLATLNGGYGDDIVRFYPPAMYYLLAAGRFITGNWYAGSLLAITFGSGLGGVAAYFWARCYVSPRLAVVAALFYALMPYRLAEVYQAAQLAEFFAGAALLFALAFTKRVCDQRRWRDVAGLAASYAALTLTHLPMAVFGSLTLFLYALVNVFIDSRRVSDRPQISLNLDTFFKLTTAVVLGLAASSFYWMTMLTELKWIIGDGANPDPMVNYRYNFVFSSFSSDQQETVWWMGLLAIATILMTIPAMGAFVRNKGHRAGLAGLLIILIFAFLMSTVASKPLWMIIPYLEKTQHPFRWLAVVSTVAPILMAASLPFWSEQLRKRGRAVAFAMAGLVLIAITFSLSQTVRGARYLSGADFNRVLSPAREVGGVIQWLPIWARASAGDRPTYQRCTPPANTSRVEVANRVTQIIDWSDLHRSFAIAGGAPADVRIATFYYPHWIASTNGRALPTRAAADGALVVEAPAGEAIVNLDFREPSRARIADVISIISWTLIATLLIFGTFAAARHEPIAN